MKSLNEVLNEGIFDKNLTINDEDLVKNWVETYLPEHVNRVNIDMNTKTIALNGGGSSGFAMEIDASTQPFDAFIPFKFTNFGKPVESITLKGDIRGLKDLPKQITGISIYPDKKTHSFNENIIDDINKNVKSLKTLTFLTNWKELGWVKIDLSKLKIPVKTLYVGELDDNGGVTFNTDTKTEILQVGYGALNGKFANLPIFKTISFKTGDFETIKNWVEKIGDMGKSNFEKIIVNCSTLNKEEKDAIKTILQGGRTDFRGFNDILKKLKLINTDRNYDKDATRDLFGCPLEPGDVVIVVDSTNPKYPSQLDIYKSSTSGGRIRTDSFSMANPRNIIKLNNPKLLELLK